MASERRRVLVARFVGLGNLFPLNHVKGLMLYSIFEKRRCGCLGKPLPWR